jgi:hypothetical protein
VCEERRTNVCNYFLLFTMKLLFFRSLLLSGTWKFLINFLCFMSEGEREREVKLVKEGKSESEMESTDSTLFFTSIFSRLDLPKTRISCLSSKKALSHCVFKLYRSCLAFFFLNFRSLLYYVSACLCLSMYT